MQLEKTPAMEALARQAAQAYADYQHTKSPLDYKSSRGSFGATALLGTKREALDSALSELHRTAEAHNEAFFSSMDSGPVALRIRTEREFIGALNTYIAGIAQQAGITNVPADKAYYNERSIGVSLGTVSI